MSTTWMDDMPADSAEDDSAFEADENEDEDDEEDFEFADEAEDDEESRASRRRRRARAARLAAARRRQARIRMHGGRPRRPRPIAAGRPASAAAIRAVDVESKVASDDLRRQLASQRKRMSRSEYAAVAGLAANQAIQSFNQPKNPYARAAILASPLALLSPQRRSRGLGGFVTDPRVVGAALILGITFAGERRKKLKIELTLPRELRVGTSFKLNARVVSADGEVQKQAVDVIALDANVATIAGGVLTTGGNPGAVEIVATAPGVPDFRATLLVLP